MGFLQYICVYLKNHDANLTGLKDKFIQKENLVTCLDPHLDELQKQLDKVVADHTHQRTASRIQLGERDAARPHVATLQGQVADLGAQAKVPRVLPAELADTHCERERYKV